MSAHQTFAPDKALPVRPDGAAQRDPSDPDADQQSEGEEGALQHQQRQSHLLFTSKMAQRTMNAFQCELTGAFPPKMMVRRRADRGVFSHSSSVISSCACQAVQSGTVLCMRPKSENKSPGGTHLGPAAVVHMPNVVDLLLDLGEVLVEVGERV